MADATRLKIVYTLQQGESSVSDIAAVTGTSLAVASQHLRKLLLQGLVTSRREGKQVIYGLSNTRLSNLISSALTGDIVSDTQRPARIEWRGHRLGGLNITHESLRRVDQPRIDIAASGISATETPNTQDTTSTPLAAQLNPPTSEKT